MTTMPTTITPGPLFTECLVIWRRTLVEGIATEAARSVGMKRE